MRESATSKAASGSASASASAARTSTWPRPSAAARRAAIAVISAATSVRTTAPSGPTSSAATRPTPPGPQATSSTRSPVAGAARRSSASVTGAPCSSTRAAWRSQPGAAAAHCARCTARSSSASTRRRYRAHASLAAVRILALADAPPRRPVPELVAAGRPDLVVLLGDLEPAWVDGLAGLDVPRLGVHGNHDDPGSLAALGAEDVHLRRVDVDGVSFSGLSGSPRYSREGRFEWTQAEAAKLLGRLPAADVLLTHAPPEGVNDEPGDPVHTGWTALRAWVEEHRPAWLLHGHTGVPLPPARPVHRLGPTRVVHVRGSALIDLPPSEAAGA